MADIAVKKDKTFLHLAVYLVIAALGWIIPPAEPITAEGMKLLGIFIAAIYGWSITPDIWPSILTFLLLPFAGILDLNGVLAATMGSDTFLTMIFIMVMVGFLENTGTTSYVAAFLMTRKALKGHPWRLIFMIFLIAWLLSTFCGNMPGMMITWGFIYKICDVLDYKPFDKFASLMIFGVAVMGALSLSSVPWANNALVILGSYMQSSGEKINYLHYLAYSVPNAIFCILGFLALCKFVFRLDVSRLKNLDTSVFGGDLELTAERKIALSALGVMIFLLVVPGLMPAGTAIRTLADKTGICMKMGVVLFVLTFIKVDGKKIFNFGQLASKKVPWPMMMMMIGILSFVAMLGNPATGISAFLSQLFTPMFQGTSVVVFFLLVLVITVFLTNFMINMVVAVIMISATLPLCSVLGVVPLQVVYLITVSCTIAFILPAASAASCVLFANTEWVRAKDVYKFGFPTIIMMAAVTLIWNIILFSF